MRRRNRKLHLNSESKLNRIRVAGFDPSFRNWGMSFGWLDLDSLSYTIDGLHLIQTASSSDKKIKKNTSDTESAFQLQKGVLDKISEHEVKMVFAELPDSGQSYRAGVGQGIILSSMARLRLEGVPVVYLTYSQLKMAATNTQNATKKQMISWAKSKFPDAPWLCHTRKGKTHKKGDPDDTRNEHLADSIAAIEAGVQDPEFLSILGILRMQNGK